MKPKAITAGAGVRDQGLEIEGQEEKPSQGVGLIAQTWGQRTPSVENVRIDK
jgi:hypothetical protein